MKISVVIPARNEQASIRALLDSLLNQTLPPAEIVITDGGSTDGTAAIISEFIERGAPINLIRSTPALPGRGRNLAAAQAQNEWLAFIDAGTTPESNWLESLAKAVETDTDVVYGTYEPVTDSQFKVCAVIAYIAPPSVNNGSLIRPCSVVSMLAKRSVWETVGGFPEHLRSAEDLLFMRKIEAAGFKIVRAPDALVHWQVQATAWGTFKRFIGYARSNMRAGLWHEWQARVFMRYGLLLLSALPAIFLGSKWLLVTLVLWLFFQGARTFVSLWRNRVIYPATVFQSFIRGLMLALLLGLLDVATIVGTLQWLFTDALKAEPASEIIDQTPKAFS
jgi:cellulose synthase/poly-beta-1,6-N-acetylglucosamine synthase-like glycosyltransferase